MQENPITCWHDVMPTLCAALFLWLSVQGDQLIATSGVVYTKESDYGGAKVKMGQQVVRMTVMGEVSGRADGPNQGGRRLRATPGDCWVDGTCHTEAFSTQPAQKGA
jgi:hypothetical protein